MTDSAGDRREAKRFEPPPWELAQFEEREQARERTGTGPAEAAPTRSAASDGPGGGERERTVPEGGGGPSDERVEAMLVQLRAEEPRTDTHTRTVSVFSAGVMMFMGVCMIAWGGIAAAMAKGQITGLIGALIVFVMGGLFGATGLWLGLRATRRED